MKTLSAAIKRYSHFLRVLSRTRPAHLLSRTQTDLQLIPLKRLTYITNSFSQFSLPRHPCHSLVYVRYKSDTNPGHSRLWYMRHDAVPEGILISNPKMEEFTISCSGISKLLQNLKPCKAVGPDKLKPLLLRGNCSNYSSHL